MLLPFLLELTVDWEYFGVSKVMWAKWSMSFNFVNLAGIQIYFITLDILLHEFFCITCMCIVIEMAVYEMESGVHGYHV